MHALGVVATNYNHLEFVFLLLFAHYMRGYAAATVTFANLNNRYRKDVMQALLDDEERDPIIRDRLDHFLVGFDICAENRNFLMHSLTQNAGPSLGTTAKLHLELGKRARSEPLRTNYARLSIENLRDIADEIDTYDNYGFNLLLWLMARPAGGRLTLPGSPERVPPLPDKPAPPKKLTLFDSPAPTDKPSLPEPSPASPQSPQEG
jgi:hypothetical protein